ncbi:MAG: stage III sporulation protein AF [Clostridiales bacterium]|nr:stage III sporulation protein AF [Clostridiales bacterium]
MELLKEWLLGVLAVSFLTAAAQIIMPDGAVKQVGRLACGLILFLAIIRPLLGMDYGSLSQVIRDYQEELSAQQETLEKTGKELTGDIIAEETDAYIQDMTEELGLDCQIAVEWSWEGETPAPVRAIVTGELSDGDWAALTEALVRDFGLEREQIVYQEPEDKEGT